MWPTVILCVYGVHVYVFVFPCMNAYVWGHVCGFICMHMNMCVGLKLTFMSSSISHHFPYWGKVSGSTWNSPILFHLRSHLSLESLPLESPALSYVINSGGWKPGLRAPDAPLCPLRGVPQAPAESLSRAFFLIHTIPSLFMGVSSILHNWCKPLFQFL